jgi:hypothetical protein
MLITVTMTERFTRRFIFCSDRYWQKYHAESGDDVLVLLTEGRGELMHMLGNESMLPFSIVAWKLPCRIAGGDCRHMHMSRSIRDPLKYLLQSVRTSLYALILRRLTRPFEN